MYYGTDGTSTKGWYNLPETMIYPDEEGIVVYNGSSGWGTSITDNSANWNTAYGWGNHASAGYVYVSGTPVDNQVAVWTSADTIEGDSNFTWDGTTLALAGSSILSTYQAYVSNTLYFPNTGDVITCNNAINNSVALYWDGVAAHTNSARQIRFIYQTKAGIYMTMYSTGFAGYPNYAGKFVIDYFGDPTLSPGLVLKTGTSPIYMGQAIFGQIPNAFVLTDIGTFNTRVVSSASTTTRAGLNIPHGTAPTAPINGDIWTTTSGLYVRINGVTVGPLGEGGGFDSGDIYGYTFVDSLVEESDFTVHLDGDETSPGNSKYYGTDGTGTKGFYDLPEEGSTYTFQLSIVEESDGGVNLVGDQDSPGNDKLYGTNGVGVKGWYDQPSGGGYTNLTSFVDQTAWRLFYSNGSGDVTELALGADGTYLKSNGATSAPTFDTPAGGTTPVDSTLLDWSTDRYVAYSSRQSGGEFYTDSATLPNQTTYMSYNGIFVANYLGTVNDLAVGVGTGFSMGSLCIFLQSTILKLSFLNSSVDYCHLHPAVTNVAGEIAYFYDTTSLLDAAGTKLGSWSNHGTEKVAFDSEGKVYATKFVNAYVGVGDTAIVSHDAEANTASTSYVKLKTITLGANMRPGRTLRIKFDLHNSTTGPPYAYGRIYRNGVAVGTEQTTPSDSYVTKSEDITDWDSGDTIELWMKAISTYTAYVQNFRVCGILYSSPISEVTGTTS